MKKTMFITSIVMVVVLAVALTTSSLAWFSATGNNEAHVTSFTLQANTHTSSAGLEISNNGTTWLNGSISLSLNGSTGLDPMCPTGTIADTTAVTATEFYNSLNHMMTSQIENRWDAESSTYKDYFASANPSSASAAAELFYIRNSGDTITGLQTTITVTGTHDYDPVLWVAVFDITDVTFSTAGNFRSNVAAASVAQPKLLGIAKKSGQTNNITWTANPATTMAQDALVSGVGTINPANVTKTNAGDEQLEPKTYDEGVVTDGKKHTLVIFAWFDGSTLVNANGGSTMTIQVDFALAAVTEPEQQGGGE